MLPNTRNTIQRIRKLTSAKDSESLSISVSDDDMDNGKSHEGTFTSNDFQSMYTTTATGINSNSINDDRHIDEYKYSYPFEDELSASSLPNHVL